ARGHGRCVDRNPGRPRCAVEAGMRIALTYNERRTAGEAEAEFDTREAVESIARIAAGLGHRVTLVDVTGSRLGEARSIPRLVTRLARLAPDLVWNLAEGERGPFRE